MSSFLAKWLHQDKAIAAMGTMILGVLMTVTPHFFLDMLLIATYSHAQSPFQRFYLNIHFACTIVSFIITTYSFWAVNAQTYHAFCNMRSWSLLIGGFMFFSGFFAILGFALDWHKFRAQCDSDMSFSTMSRETLHCHEIWAAIISSVSVLWVFTEVCYCLLVVFIERYKRVHFAEQEQEKEDRQREALLNRYRTLGMKKQEAFDKVEQVYASNKRSVENEQERVFEEMGKMMHADEHVRHSSSTAGKTVRSMSMPFVPRRAMSFFSPKLDQDGEQQITTKNNDGKVMCDSPEILVDPPTPRGWQRDPDEIHVISQTPTTANVPASSPSREERNRLVRPSRNGVPALTVESPGGAVHTLRPPRPQHSRPRRSMT